MLNWCTRAGLILGLLALPIVAQQPGDQPRAVPDQNAPARVMLRYAQFDPLVQQPGIPAALRGGMDTNLYLVQSVGPPRADYREAIRTAGGQVHGFMPENAHLVRMGIETAVHVGQMPFVRWIGRYEPAYRLEPALIAEHLDGSVVPQRKYNIVVVDKRTDKPGLVAKLQGVGAIEIDEMEGSILTVATMTGVQLLQAARFDEVLWIDRWTPPEEDMNNARIQGGGNYVEGAGGYNGAGIRAHVYEGLEASHPDFTLTPINVQSCGTAQAHGHCTAGIVAGNGTSHPNARGMAPNAQLYYTNYSCVSGGWSRWQVIQNVVNTRNCFQTTASWGNARTTEYTSISAETDDIIFDHDIPWTQSQSNAGNTSIPRNSRPQAWAKNVFAIGAVQHFDNSTPADDSWLAGAGSIGFASDGRIKPDLCAYYDATWTSDLTGTAGYASGSYYTSFGGTSGATPIVNGHLALAQQMFTDGIFHNALRNPTGSRFSNRGHAPTMRALLIATAKQYPFTSTSTDNKREHQGWGFPDLRKMWDSRNKMMVVDETDVLVQGQTKTYYLAVPPGEPELKIAMCYIDPQGNPAASFYRINDLDLTVNPPSTGPFTLLYRGNVGLKTGNYSSPGGAADDRDTTECVFIQNPAAGIWTIRVNARLVVMDTHLETGAVDVDYGLVAVGGSRAGRCPTAFYVPDDDATSGTCNFIPFGDGSGNWDRVKYQTVMTRDDLDGHAGPITGLAFAPCGSGLRSHDTLTVRMSHVPRGYTLSSVFAANMPAPVTVLTARGYYWNNIADQWNPVGLQRYFPYNGRDDVVVEITTIGNGFPSSAVQGVHRDTRPRLQTYNWTGAPPPTGTVDNAAVKMEVSFGCARHSVHGRGCAGLSLDVKGSTMIGNAYSVLASGGAAGGPAFLNIGLNNGPPVYPWDLAPLGFKGCSLWHDIIVTLNTTMNSSGIASISFSVPNTPVLIGALWYAQWAHPNRSAPGGWAFSDYARLVHGL